MPDEEDLNPDEIREEMRSAVERIREEFRRRHPDTVEPEPEPGILSESEPRKDLSTPTS